MIGRISCDSSYELFLEFFVLSPHLSLQLLLLSYRHYYPSFFIMISRLLYFSGSECCPRCLFVMIPIMMIFLVLEAGYIIVNSRLSRGEDDIFLFSYLRRLDGLSLLLVIALSSASVAILTTACSY